MKAYSEDLREPVIRAVETDRPREEVAARFEVSVPTIVMLLHDLALVA